MTTRREFLQAGIAVSALPLGATIRAAALPADTEPGGAPPFYKVVFDERFAESGTFAAEMRARGAELERIHADITDFWYRDLYFVWRDRPTAVAGLTAHGPLFCLEQLARDHRMRVVLRAEHHFRANASVEHRIAAPDDVVTRAAGLAQAGAAWPVQLASLLCGCSTGRHGQPATLLTPRAHAGNEGRDPLYSWVIAPAGV